MRFVSARNPPFIKRCKAPSNSELRVNLAGRSIVGFTPSASAAETFQAVNPVTGKQLEPDFFCATPSDVDTAARLAHEAFAAYSHVPGREKAVFLRKIANNIESVAASLVERAQLETALPQARLQAETARTCAQLRLFAEVVEEGSWVMARIDRADPDRKPAPRPDLRSMLRPIGPVAVFGASNFPLAFSVAGGDTASALAAGSPVIVKAHPAHPGTSEIAASALQKSVRECGLPEGVFSLLFDSGTRVGTMLIQHPHIRAAGFTGSRAAGQALMKVAAARPEPIPFFVEMSSTNPLFILPGALRDRCDQIAAGLHASFTMGAGQFCTKPGIIFLPGDADARRFVSQLETLVKASPAFHLLTEGIKSSYCSSLTARQARKDVKLLARTSASGSVGGFAVDTALLETSVESFLTDADLAKEMFGPSTLLVRSLSRDQLLEAARSLEGHLTASIHGTEEDLRNFAGLIAILEDKVGRLIFNGFPTGVEVSHAMVHGGPYPATSDGQSTSVGSRAIFRFARPVCYQGFPQARLPEALQDGNPLQIWRMVDGKMSREPLA
jgi:alpha-ketoglutaric semialdehyde dehydrogenase